MTCFLIYISGSSRAIILNNIHTSEKRVSQIFCKSTYFLDVMKIPTELNHVDYDQTEQIILRITLKLQIGEPNHPTDRSPDFSHHFFHLNLNYLE